jgi:alpha-D-ribose 1-methylphosphonate 5-triphosphate synthase subunit PhnH
MVSLFQQNDLIRQCVFRAILKAFSRPGQIFTLPETNEQNERTGSLRLVLETLLDHEVSHCLIDADDAGQLQRTICEAAKSSPAPLEEADFIVAASGSTHGRIYRAKRGQTEYPDLSATVIYAVESIFRGKNAPVNCVLRGPGIVDHQAFPAMEGFDCRELKALCAVNVDFPLGVDALFVDRQGLLAAAPRSTRIQIKEPSWPTQR